MEQAWTADATDADRHFAVIMGDVFVAGWSFGNVVVMVGPAITIPALAASSISIPTLGNVSLEV